MQANLRDVARSAGVSLSTASRAINAPDTVSASKRESVYAAVRELGYKQKRTSPSSDARHFASLCLIVPDLGNPFFTAVAKAALGRASELGLTMYVADSDEDRTREISLAQRHSALVDALIWCSPRSPESQILEVNMKVPGVLLNRSIAGMPSVLLDDGSGMKQVISHLVALGHRQIAYAGGPKDSWTQAARRAVIVSYADEHDEIDLYELGNFSPVHTGGVLAADLAMAAGVTAIIAYNDLMALGILERLRDQGANVPEDISVVGFDGIQAQIGGATPLTTVAAPFSRMGRTAVDLAANLNSDNSGLPSRYLLPVELVVNSTAGPRTHIG